MDTKFLVFRNAFIAIHTSESGQTAMQSEYFDIHMRKFGSYKLVFNALRI